MCKRNVLGCKSESAAWSGVVVCLCIVGVMIVCGGLVGAIVMTIIKTLVYGGDCATLAMGLVITPVNPVIAVRIAAATIRYLKNEQTSLDLGVLAWYRQYCLEQGVEAMPPDGFDSETWADILDAIVGQENVRCCDSGVRQRVRRTG